MWKVRSPGERPSESDVRVTAGEKEAIDVNSPLSGFPRGTRGRSKDAWPRAEDGEGGKKGKTAVRIHDS